jgi:lactate permease
VWRPKRVLGYGGVTLSAEALAKAPRAEALASDQVLIAWAPFVVLVVIVTLWTGPWSPLPKIVLYSAKVVATAPETGAMTAASFSFAPFVGGSAILASWIVVALLLAALGKLKADHLGEIFAKTFHQVWGAFLVGVFIFGLAYVFNFSGMAASLAKGFSGLGAGFIVAAPILGFIGVALSGSNTSTNAMFGKFQALVGAQLGMPPLLLPSLNSVGAEIGKPIAPQTASVGVSTSRFVRNEGEVIRHNLGWTLILLVYLIVIGVGFYWAGAGVMNLPKP